MTDRSRRNFLKQLGAASAVFLAGRNAWAAGPRRDFEMLVVGDSLIAGQGLREEQKFYTLTRNWLEEEFFGRKRRVVLKNRSHSGSRIFLAPDEVRALADAELDPEEFHHPEINVSFPSMKAQIDVAAREYEREGKRPGDVRLILLSGGITNINSSYILNPFKDNDKLRELIDRYCNEAMFRFLNHAGETFPRAVIAVVGYFPMVSKKSSTGEVYNAILELYDFPGPFKPVVNNLLTKQFFKIVHRKMNKRSRIWFEGSNEALRTAVGRFNEENGRRAVFVRSPITEERCFGTKDPLLWGMAKKGRSEDFLYDTRVEVCEKTIESFRDVDLKFKTRFCELSGIGHPNVEGAQAYASAIRETLRENEDLFASVLT